MSKLLYSLIALLTLTSPTLRGQYFIPPQPRDTVGRTLLQKYDYDIKEKDRRFFIDRYNPSDTKLPLDFTGKFQFHRGNGLRIDLDLKDNIVVGSWLSFKESYHSIGFVQQSHFVDGYKDGEEINYDYNYDSELGRYVSYVTSVVLYNMGYKTKKTAYYSNGQLNYEELYDEHEKANGYTTYYYENGNIQSHGKKEQGKNVGDWNYYYEEKDSLLQLQHIDKGDSTFYSVSYYPNGNVESHTLRDNETYKFIGEFVYLGIEGDTLSHMYANRQGVEQGPQISLKLGTKYIGSRIYGSKKSRYEEDRYRTFYTTDQNGVVVGEYVQRYYVSNFLRVKGFYNDKGQRDRLWEYYTLDGRLYRSELFENGELKGTRIRHLNYAGTDEPVIITVHLDIFPPEKWRLDPYDYFILFP